MNERAEMETMDLIISGNWFSLHDAVNVWKARWINCQEQAGLC